MGTPAACIYATIYYAYHEIKILLPKYKNNLLFFKIFIDGMFGIWIPSDDQNSWKTSKITNGLVSWNGKWKNTRRVLTF